jgi:hypothetical protein
VEGVAEMFVCRVIVGMPVSPDIRGVFLDNAQEHIDTIGARFRNIRTIKIPDSGNMYNPGAPIVGTGIYKLPFNEDNDLTKLIESLGVNVYADALPAVGVKVDAYDTRSGIEVDTVETMMEHINTMLETPAEPVYAIFDWDRTLTRFEGWYTIESIAQSLAHPRRRDKIILTVEDMQKMKEDRLLYLFEGYERLGWIRYVLNTLFERGVIVCILSNNRACTTPEFREMIQLLDSRIQHIICSYTNVYYGNKAAALADYTFPEATVPESPASASPVPASPAPAGGAGAGARYGGRSRKNKKRTRRTRNRKRNRH